MTFEEFKKFYLQDMEILNNKYYGKPLDNYTRDKYVYEFIELHHKYNLILSREHIFCSIGNIGLTCTFTEDGLQLIEDYKKKELYKYLTIERYLE